MQFYFGTMSIIHACHWIIDRISAIFGTKKYTGYVFFLKFNLLSNLIIISVVKVRCTVYICRVLYFYFFLFSRCIRDIVWIIFIQFVGIYLLPKIEYIVKNWLIYTTSWLYMEVCNVLVFMPLHIKTSQNCEWNCT